MSLGKKVGTSQETQSNDGGGAASVRIRDVRKGCRTDRCHSGFVELNLQIHGECWHLGQLFSECGPWPVASAASGNLLERQIPEPTSGLLNQNSGGDKPSTGFWYVPNYENHQFRSGLFKLVQMLSLPLVAPNRVVSLAFVPILLLPTFCFALRSSCSVQCACSDYNVLLQDLSHTPSLLFCENISYDCMLLVMLSTLLYHNNGIRILVSRCSCGIFWNVNFSPWISVTHGISPFRQLQRRLRDVKKKKGLWLSKMETFMLWVEEGVRRESSTTWWGPVTRLYLPLHLWVKWREITVLKYGSLQI